MWKDYLFQVIPGRTKIEYDKKGEEANLKNHLYSLSCGKDIFECHTPFQQLLVTSEPYIDNNELLHMHLAKHMGKIVFIVTAMLPEETIRIVSIREADSEEKEIYHKRLRIKVQAKPAAGYGSMTIDNINGMLKNVCGNK